MVLKNIKPCNSAIAYLNNNYSYAFATAGSRPAKGVKEELVTVGIIGRFRSRITPRITAFRIINKGMHGS